MARVFSRSVLLGLVILLAAAFTVAQVGQTTGRLEGTVKDQTGGVIPGVTITLASVTGTKTTVTGDNGEFSFPYLTPGTYDLKAELEGFKAFEQKGLAVRLGGASQLNVVLTPGEISDVITVTGEAPLVDTTTTTIGANISNSLYNSVPVQRNFISLLNLAPGVADGGGTGVSNPSIGGGTGLENNIVVDGVNITNPGFGGTGVYSQIYGSMGTGVNFDFVKEVQVKSGGFEAEYGQSTGGVVNVITKSGGNEFHGGVYTYIAPAGFQAARKQPNTYKQTKVDYFLSQDAMDVSFDLNGYLAKDKFFFYMGFNPQRIGVRRMAPNASAQWTNGLTEERGYFSQYDYIYSWSGKATWQMTSNHNFEFSTTADPSKRPVGPLRTLNGDYDNGYGRLSYGSWNFITKYNGVLTNNWFLTSSFGRAYSRFTETALYPDLIGYNDWTIIPDRPARGGLGFINNNANENWQFNIKTTFNVEAGGSHTFDLGYSYEDIAHNGGRGYTGPVWPFPAYSFTRADGSVYNFAGGSTYGIAGRLRPATAATPSSTGTYFQQTRGNIIPPVMDTTSTYHSFYMQDAWKISSHLTFKAGLRYDYQKMRGTGDEALEYIFDGNWAPRFGMIYDVFGDGKTKIYGSFGRFYEKIPLDICIRSFSNETGYTGGLFEASLDSQGRIILGTFLNPILQRTVGITGGTTAVVEGTKSMYQNEFVLGVDHQLKPDLSLGARFIWRDLGRVLEDIGTVSLAQDALGIIQNFAIANPSFSSDVCNNTNGDLGPDGLGDGFVDPLRSYTALEVTLEKRFSNDFQFMANYRLAKLWGNYEGLFRNDNGQNDPNISSLWDYRWDGTEADPLYWQFQSGYLNTDRRHTLNFNGAYIYNKFTIGIGARFASGTPVTGLNAHPAYLNAGELPDGPRGNRGRTDWINNVDLHFDYPFTFGDRYKIRLGLDMFNVFNRQKVNTYDQRIQLGSPGAGIPGEINLDFLTPNQIQRSFNGRLSLRFEF